MSGTMSRRRKDGRFMSSYEEGREDGANDERDASLAILKLYVQHIGNCGAVGSDPEDSRCICGLRQIWMGR